jgi:hypothetical protein
VRFCDLCLFIYWPDTGLPGILLLILWIQ